MFVFWLFYGIGIAALLVGIAFAIWLVSMFARPSGRVGWDTFFFVLFLAAAGLTVGIWMTTHYGGLVLP